ncbi:MAG TPA: VWA domain-containing protein [Polyangiaceae bacterium LLY-WYZ-15_(1-7)]|nr:VWA domain-containing protein [Polyangiaceae bacterium LLY-WYZ-15_(1-7)]HJL08990.1 VWA domain-containing protein [Polyangiaceae bacterium LLY-WYZ-15_(1-7)]HJL34117.1 VWA domain-containing protein [Polyangiaceae bacterium LLY-WYZ-15_(1-7)]
MNVLMRLARRARARRRAPGAPYAAALGAAALAVAGLVLVQPPPATGAPPSPPPSASPPASPSAPTQAATSAPATTLRQGPLTARVQLSQGAVMTGADRLAMTLELTADDVDVERPPVSLALVLDVSGSMSGEKLGQAKRAVTDTVARMRDGDQLALITYDSTSRVVVPLGPVGARRGAIAAAVTRIAAGGGTQIPDGLALGERALRDAPDAHVRRIVLVSDGIDGSGLGPDGVGALVRGWTPRGVSVASLGIGLDYDERFLTAVADAGRGAYAFLQSGAELEPFLVKELDRAGSTVAENVAIDLAFAGDLRITAAHGAEVQPGSTRVPFGPMAAGETRLVVLEIASRAERAGPLGDVRASLRFRDRAGDVPAAIEGAPLSLVAVGDAAAVEASRDPATWAQAEAIRLEREQARAIERWRAGDGAAAAALATSNAAGLRELQAHHDSPWIRQQLAEVEADAERFERMPAASAEGRAYGLRSNARRRARVQTGVYQ